MEKAIIDPKKIVRPVGDVLKIRAGWEQTITAQLLWTQAMAEAEGVIVQMQVENDDPRVDYAPGQRMPTYMRQWLRRLRPRALQLAKHTCDVCGATTQAKTKFPVRCSEHIESEEKTEEIDVSGFAIRRFPQHEIADMAVTNPELAMLGDDLIAASVLTFSDELLCAAYALNQCVNWMDTNHYNLACTVEEAIQSSPETVLIEPEEIAEVVSSIDVVERLIETKTLMAAVRVWARHGFMDEKLQSLAGNAIARVDMFHANQAVEKMMREQRR